MAPNSKLPPPATTAELFLAALLTEVQQLKELVAAILDERKNGAAQPGDGIVLRERAKRKKSF